MAFRPFQLDDPIDEWRLTYPNALAFLNVCSDGQVLSGRNVEVPLCKGVARSLSTNLRPHELKCFRGLSIAKRTSVREKGSFVDFYKYVSAMRPSSFYADSEGYSIMTILTEAGELQNRLDLKISNAREKLPLPLKVRSPADLKALFGEEGEEQVEHQPPAKRVCRASVREFLSQLSPDEVEVIVTEAAAARAARGQAEERVQIE